MMRFKRWLREGVWLLLIATVALWGVDRLRAPALPDDLATLVVKDMQGNLLSLAELSESQPLLIYVWASWCGICKLTTPSVAKMIANGETVLNVALRSGDNARVQQWMSKKGLNGPGINDEKGELTQHWDIAATPTFIVLHKGKVTSSTSGWTSRWGLEFRLWLAHF